jgi:hypothetical protein
MRTFFRGRLAPFFSVVCAATMVLNQAEAAAAGLAFTLTTQPVDMYQAPPPQDASPAVVAQPAAPYRDTAAPNDMISAQPQKPPQPSATSDGPATAPASPPVVESRQPPRPSPYRCKAGRDVQETLARCESTDTGENVGHKHGQENFLWGLLVAAVIGVLISATLHKTKFSSGTDMPTEQTLLEQGPQLPAIYPDGSLSVRGFARDGWPVVVDFEPQPGTITQLEVTTYRGRHKHTEKLVLDPDGSHGRQVVRVAMPMTGSASNPVPATYAVSSVPISTFDTDQPQAVGLAPLKIYGIGGGPHAVGSVAIEQLAFTQVSPGARFGYFSKSEFNRARAQVQQLQRASDGTFQIQPVIEFFGSNLSVGPHGGIWSGPEPSSSLRTFRLQVTAWYTNDDRSWVAALAPDLITQ